MKKYFKTQFKKSLSLMMAVLMVLSCWVWIAPELDLEAEAADYSNDGYYYVQVFGNYHDWTNGTGVQKNDWIVTFKENNGTGTERTQTLSFVQDPKYGNHPNIEGAALNNIIIAAGWVPGFPTKVRHEYNVSGCGSDSFGVQPREFWVGNKEDTTNRSGTKVAAYTDQYSANSNNGYDIFNVDLNSYKPVATSFKSTSGSMEKKTISDIPKLGSTEVKSVTCSAGGAYDQYGVRLLTGEVSYFIGADQNGSAEYTKDGQGIWAEKNVVKANANVQKGVTSTTGSAKVYLIATQGNQKGAIAEITLEYPNYTVSVDPKGSVTDSGFNPTMGMSDNSTQTVTWTKKGAYSATAAAYPNGTAAASGYTFKGFWTTKQPTTGDAGTNASEATFATPVSSDDFVNVYGGTEGAEYVEKDGKKYFNAGTQWDGATHKEILGDKAFYGWWVPKDIVVKFYDVDGTFMGTQIAKYGAKPGEDWYPNPKDGYNAGAYDYQGFAKQWRDITGAVITEGTYTFGALEELSLTPIYTNKTYSDKYQVNFVNPADGSNISPNSKEYEYRHILNGSDIPTVGVPAVLVNDPGYSYEFSGWTSQAPASGNYHKVAKDDTAIVENTDWVVREEIKYYPIFRSTVKEYLVNFKYTDSTGTAKTELVNVPYGSVISTPNVVNRTYATGGYGYTLEGWDYQTNTGATVMLGADATLVFDNTKVFITTNNLAPNGTAIVFTANYDEGKPTPYTVTFKYKDAKGIDQTVTDEVYHGYNISAETVGMLNVPAQYDDGEALYTFSDLWKVTEGTADKAEYAKNEFTSFSPTSHVTFEAVYGEGVPFYTVTYIDGANTYSERILAGSNVPAWMVEVDGEEKEYVPANRKSETGEYKFVGWFDEEQTDKEFKETNGTEYTTDSKVNDNLTLYSQFKFEAFKFTVKFMNFDGTEVLASGEKEAGDSFKDIYDEAMENTDRASDKIYSYTFIGWDHKVPENFLCEGKDMTYTAQYRPSYIYYKVRWYNDLKSMNDADPEFETVGQEGLLAITSHTYEGKIYAPSVELTAPEGKVFTGWKYIKDGVETDYVRGMLITDGMSFYATYDKDATVTHTVTTVVDGEETEYEVEDGGKADAIGTPVDGFVDENNHNKFEGWFTEDGEKFDLETAITDDIKIIAHFTVTAHTKDQKEIVSVPTYYKKGSEKVWCACSKEATIKTVEIPMLTDTVAPTGTIYLGTLGQWSSTDENGAAATDGNKVTLYANADTDIILTINDTGDVDNAFNPKGEGKGIAIIQGIISTDVFDAEATEIAGIKTIFTDGSETLNNTANYVIRLGEYEGLEDGKTYIAYYYVKDKAGNELNKNVRTAKFIYDNTAPVITIDGDNNKEKVPTYCGKAVIKNIENDATVTVNGNEVELTTAGVSGTTAYTISEAGNYIITITDKAGNTASKKIIVVEGHDEVTTSKDATCTENGYEKVTCALCGKVIKNDVIEAAGEHAYGKPVTVDPTCTEDGYTVKTCTACGDEVVTKGDEKTGHTYNKDADGNVIYVTVTPSTCKVKGKAEAVCTVCGEGKLEKELELDTENGHTYGGTKVLRATCTQDGEEYQNCKYCYAKKTVKVLPKLNHVDTGRYTKITTAATCYSEGVETTYCKACDTVMSTAPVAKIAHTLKLVEYKDENNDDAENYPNGYMQYECQATGCTHTEGKTAIAVKATYTVTFKGAGAEGADVVITKTEGESIVANAVADQTKASDNEYNYTFAGWKGSDGKVIKLPVKVTKNETYTAEFTATKRIYTHTFKVNATDTADYATIIGYYNAENKKPASIPTKAATATATYEFKGWVKTGDTTGALVDSFKMTEDATFVASFKEVPVEFNVIFYNEDGSYIWSTKGDSTKKVKYANTDGEGKLIVPAKAPDAESHYTFAGWKLGDGTIAIDAEFGITGKTTLTATYTSADHSFAVVNDAAKTWAATCTKAGQTTEKCSACGYEKVTVVPMIEHNYELQEDGSKKCSGCGDVIEAETQEFTITFEESVTGDETATDTLKTYKVEEGKDKTYTAPEKAATAEFEYKFINWTDEDGNVVSDKAEITVTATADATYTANYKATTRVYTVTYVDADRKEIVSYQLAYGATVPAAPATAPTKAYTTTDHYDFAGWSVAVGTTVTGDILIQPEFDVVAHTWKETDESAGATCTEAGGAVWACTGCAAKEKRGGKPATGHSFKVTVVAPTATEKGYMLYDCENCDYSEIKDLPADYFTITVKVLDENGNPAKDVLVKLLKDGVEVMSRETNGEGIAIFSPVDRNTEYKVYISSTGETKDVTVNEDGKVTGGNIESKPEKEEEDNSCKCTCHKNTFWGVIFRLFQKIIKLFTGKATCCSDADARI